MPRSSGRRIKHALWSTVRAQFANPVKRLFRGKDDSTQAGLSKPSTNVRQESVAMSESSQSALAMTISSAPTVSEGMRLPMDICELVVDIVAMEVQASMLWSIRYDAWWSTLIACAYTCKAWYDYSKVYLSNNEVKLTSRKEVIFLFKTIRANPRLRRTIMRVTVSGDADATTHQEAAHLGTFAVMLAGQLPKVNTLTVADMTWHLGFVHPSSLPCLAAFSSITSLILDDMTFVTVSQLASLISALPALDALKCDSLHCKQTQFIRSTPVPRNSSRITVLNIEWTTAPAILEFLVALSRAAHLEELLYQGDLAALSPEVSHCQNLLGASAASLQSFWFCPWVKDFNTGCNINLSANTKLRHLFLSPMPSLEDDYSWMPTILSSVMSINMQTLIIRFYCGGEDTVFPHLTGWLDKQDRQAKYLTDMDEILSQPQFAKMNAVKLRIIILDVTKDEVVRLSNSALDRWISLVKSRMPKSDVRGILSVTMMADDPSV